MDRKTKAEMLEKLSWIENTAQNEQEDYIETMAASLREVIEETDITVDCPRCDKSFTPPEDDYDGYCPECLKETA